MRCVSSILYLILATALAGCNKPLPVVRVDLREQIELLKGDTESKLNEFGGVSNRHSECSDCHNPHQATEVASADSTQTSTGWDATRRLAGVSGVSVVNSVTFRMVIGFSGR